MQKACKPSCCVLSTLNVMTIVRVSLVIMSKLTSLYTYNVLRGFTLIRTFRLRHGNPQLASMKHRAPSTEGLAHASPKVHGTYIVRLVCS